MANQLEANAGELEAYLGAKYLNSLNELILSQTKEDPRRADRYYIQFARVHPFLRRYRHQRLSVTLLLHLCRISC